MALVASQASTDGPPGGTLEGVAVNDVMAGPPPVPVTVTVTVRETEPAALIATHGYVVVCAGLTESLPEVPCVVTPLMMMLVAPVAVHSNKEDWPGEMVGGVAVKLVITGGQPCVPLTCAVWVAISEPLVAVSV